MNTEQKNFPWVGALVLIVIAALGVWWFTSRPATSPEQKENERQAQLDLTTTSFANVQGLQGSVTNVDHENNILFLEHSRLIEQSGESTFRSQTYEVRWDASTEFYTYDSIEAVSNDQKSSSNADVLFKNSVIIVTPRSVSGTSLTAAQIRILPTVGNIEVAQ